MVLIFAKKLEELETPYNIIGNLKNISQPAIFTPSILKIIIENWLLLCKNATGFMD